MFKLIDYSEEHFMSSGKKHLPEKRAGKFLQIRHKDSEYLVFSPGELSKYHADIAERFFARKGINGSYNRKRDYYEISDPEWEIAGGGLWKMDADNRTLHLSGSSQAYGRYDRRGLKERILALKGMSGYLLEIE